MLKIGYEKEKIDHEYIPHKKNKHKNEIIPEVDKTSIEYLKKCILAMKIV